MVYTTAPNRLTANRVGTTWDNNIPLAEHLVACSNHDHLQTHGKALRVHAPRYYEMARRTLVLSTLTLKHRRAGLAKSHFLFPGLPHLCYRVGESVPVLGLSCGILRVRDLRDSRRGRLGSGAPEVSK